MNGADRADVSVAPRATIRPARCPADLAVVRGLIGDDVARLGPGLGFQDVAGERAALPGACALPRGTILLAGIDGEAVGIGARRPLPCDSAEPKRMYPRSAARGTGLGRRLAPALVAAAREAGHPPMRLDTRDGFAPAIALYRSLGFGKVARYNGTPLPGPLFMQPELGG